MSAKSAKQKYLEIPPDAARTLAALREMGYGSFDAVMDLIDNSIDAKATFVSVMVKELSKGNITVAITDDGTGMDQKTLAEALRLGSGTKHDVKRDLGKYGMGLVTASISVARRVTLLTRQQGKQAFEAEFNLDTIERENKFVITLEPASNSSKVLDAIGDKGTLVRLENIDRISDTNVARFAANLRTQLGQVYRGFLGKGLVIKVNDRKVASRDPLMRDHPETEVVLDTTLDLGTGKARLVAVELPDLGTAEDQAQGITPITSGVYVMRNGREIMASQTFGFYRHHHSYSHFRAELSFAGELDQVFHVDVKKATIHPDDKVRDKLQSALEKVIANSGRRGRDRGEERPIKLTGHDSAASRINAVLAGSVPAAPTPPTSSDAPAKRGRPSKAMLEERAKAEAEKDKLGPTPAAPRVEFAEADTGDNGRFYLAEDKGGKLALTYNSRHPFVRFVADAKDKRVSALLDLIAFSLAKAEQEHPEGKKLVSKACDYLKLVAGGQAA